VTQPDRRQAIPHEILLGQAGFLRRLARDLVRDPQAADDVLQDVWVAALEHPPRHEGNLHGWLAAVLKNLVSKRSRAHVRRAHHELEAARTTLRQDSPAPAESESSVRFVTDSVLALDEPYRSTILMRYFEELAVQEIAERQSVPVSTVKSRLQRALEILRERMRRENGSSWSHALVGLVLPAAAVHSGSVTSVGTGVLAMTMKTKIAGAVALVLCAWFVIHEWTALRGGPADPIASSRMGTESSALGVAPSPEQPALETDAKTSDRAASAAAPAAQTAAASSALPDTLITGSLLDPAGQPISHAWSAWCTITDANGLRRVCDTSQGGSFVFSRMPFGKYWVLAYAFGFRMTSDTIDLRPDAAQVRKDITLPRMPMIRIRATTPDGKDLAEALGIDRFGGSGMTLVPVATRERPGPMLDEVSGSLNNPFGVGHFWQYGPLAEKLPKGCMGFVLLDVDPPVYMSLLNWHAVLQTKEVHPGDEEVQFVLSPEVVRASTAAIRVQVLDADGSTPLAGAGISVVVKGEEEAQGKTGPDGFASLEKIVPCEGELVIRAKDHARYSAHLVAKPGVLTDLGQVVLEDGLTLHARVLDPGGAPVSANFGLTRFDRATGRYRSEGDWRYGCGPDGSLSISFLGRERYLLRTSNLDAANDQDREGVKLVSPNVVVDLRSGVAPNALEIRLVPACTLSLVLRGESDDHWGFRVTDEQSAALVSGRFWWLIPHPLSLPPGKYAVELLDPEERPVATKSVTLGPDGATVELSR
jgi:RNA polymerase sigma-70 factor (ECF subfamily)